MRLGVHILLSYPCCTHLLRVGMHDYVMMTSLSSQVIIHLFFGFDTYSVPKSTTLTTFT